MYYMKISNMQIYDKQYSLQFNFCHYVSKYIAHVLYQNNTVINGVTLIIANEILMFPTKFDLKMSNYLTGHLSDFCFL